MKLLKWLIGDKEEVLSPTPRDYNLIDSFESKISTSREEREHIERMLRITHNYEANGNVLADALGGRRDHKE